MGRRKKKFAPKINAKKAARVITIVGVLSAIFLTIFVWMFYQPGRHTHEHLVTGTTKVRVTLQPSMVQDYVSSLAPGFTRFIGAIPKFTSMQARAFRVDWIHALPYEITFLFDQAAADKLDLTLFVNPAPDNQSFVSEVNDSGALGHLEPVRWQGGRLMPAGDQQFTVKGSVAVPEGTQDVLRAWPQLGGALYSFDRGHFIEVDVDNGGGALAAMYASMQRELWDWASDETGAGLIALWAQVAKVQVFGDVTHSDELTFEVNIVGSNNIDRASAETALGAAVQDLNDFLGERAEISFSGQGRWANSVTFEGTYRLTGFEAPIHRIWKE